MSNRIDIFQPEQTSMAMPAATVSVFVDGVLCLALEPVEIIRSQWPDFSQARLVFNPVSNTNNYFSAVEEIENMFPKGKSLSIRAFYDEETPTNVKVSGYSIFEGQIERNEIELKSDNYAIEVIARDFSAVLERVIVYGRQIIKDMVTIFLPGLETIFNPDGKPNAGSLPGQVQGNSNTVFSVKTKNSRFWKYAEVIQYLLNEYVTIGQLQIPCLERLLTLTDRQIVRDLDVTGLNLIDALQRCCERIGIKFKFVPLNVPNIPNQAIVFYKDDTARNVELNYPRSGQINISSTNITSLNCKQNFQPVTHRFVGQGEFKIYEATFELIKAWDSLLEGNVYSDFTPSTNSEFYKVRDVYRKWTLNEAGDYSEAPYNRGDAYDFSTIFQSLDYVRKCRRFWPCLTTDTQNNSLGYYLQVSYDNGLTWRQYEDAFNLLMDECGIWLSSDQLNVDLIITAMNNNLRFRMTASVISDERLTAIVANGPVNSVIPVVDHIIILPRQFRHQKISGKSIFAGSNNSNLGTPDEVDDTNALYEFIRHLAEDSSEVIETIDVQTPILGFDYNLGDIVVSSPESRDIFSCRNSRSKCFIENVKMDFQNQCTNLKIIRKRIL